MASYKAEIEVVAKGLGGVNELNAAVTKLNSALTSSQSKSSLDDRVAAMVRLRAVGDEVRKLEEQGVTLSRAHNQVKKAAEALDKGNLATARARIDVANQEVSSAKSELKVEEQITAELKEQLSISKQVVKTSNRKSGSAGRFGGSSTFQNVATGVGFPLLFGGGPLQAAAGGIGGAVGGLGGSIAASAIVSQAEAFAQAVTEAGQALNSTGGALEFMREKSLFSSKAVEENARVLEKQGEVAELSALLTEELVAKIGNEGVRSLQELGETTDETTRLWNELTLQLFALISGPLNDFLDLVNQFLGAIAQGGRREAFFGDLGEDEAAARARFKELTGESLGTGRSGSKKRQEAEAAGRVFLSQAEALLQIQKEFAAVDPVSIAVTPADRASISGSTKKSRESRAPQLEIEVALQERLNTLQQALVKAKAEENPVREAALKMEIALEEQAANIKKINLEKIPAEEKVLKIKKVELATNQEIFEAQNALNEAKAAQLEKGQEVIASLESEKGLIEAQLSGTEEEFRLKELIAEKTKGLTEEDAKRVTELIKGNQALKEQKEIADELEALYQQIGSSIASGVVDSLSAAVEGTKSLADVAADTLNNIANILLQLGVNTALSSIPGLTLFDGLNVLPGFASGGRPPVRQPSIVGERGPELFVPDTSGTIVPNGEFGMGGSTNIVVNVDAKGSSAEGPGRGKELGSAIGAAVQAELIKQKRPGGLLS